MPSGSPHTATTSPAAKSPSTSTTPEGSRLFPPRVKARTAPASVHWKPAYVRSKRRRADDLYYEGKYQEALAAYQQLQKECEQFVAAAPNDTELQLELVDTQGYAGWTLQNNLWGWGTGWSKDWDVTGDSDDAVAAMQWAQDSVYKDKWAGVSSKDQSVER